ncbi:hypothetical protein ENSA5_69230 [Enhygromyxa salina]|uniref:Uncharacterized protein n=2 Tax=Enhygromyxa salina TaxID=215803 RepID=A0A2S9XAU6_9BACT|nr:hypothetical protein ENSA5_69230 [Enhygromyxa salina]
MAELIERELLPILNIIVLLIPVAMLGLELASFGASQASMPDSRLDVAELETPRAPQPPLAAIPADEVTPVAGPARARARIEGRERGEAPRHSPPVFPDPMLGYGP